ncbi:MAG: cation-translocating P-type ATPase [Oscillospiraceae bacterium]|nr:cation-translocating P-type ATPase [Oscillospiraceae bacterium]
MNYLVKETLENIYKQFETNPKTGLTCEQIQRIQREKGLNKFDEEKRETILQKIFHHAREFTILILLVGTIISFYMAINPEIDSGYAKPVIILSIIIISIGLAIYQEKGAERALDALKNLNAPTTVVLRNGVKQEIDAAELVPGDILVLSTGDLIPADARIIESVNLRVEEALLTGESVPVEKNADAIVAEHATLGDQFNMLFSGCLITNGRTTAVVTATGMETEMGKIASLLSSTKKVKTPLQNRLHKLGKFLCIVAILSAILLFALQIWVNGESIENVLLDAVGLAVAAVPEALPPIVTVTLAFGVQNMAKKNAIIRKISAVESLGSASVICSDKTGTLTMNRMTIQKVWALGNVATHVENEFDDTEMRMLKMISLASNATIEEKGGVEQAIGDPTETAIIRLLMAKNITKKDLMDEYPRLFEIPFDSDRKLMTTLHQDKDGRYFSVTKGAFDRIPANMSEDDIKKSVEYHDEFAEDALRVLAVAYKYYDTMPEQTPEVLEKDLTFLGIVGMIDPPRPESIEAVRQAKEAGIKTIMITGDHKVTATAIAREIGILNPGDKTITGSELEEMSDEELIKNIRDYTVYARVSPNDKIRIVKAWQTYDQVVAMTGDGVNDAPALKAADVGVAMGSGTDVSKQASDIILTDDNFSSIVAAVKEGRRVYENLRKVLVFLLSANISEIFIMLLGAIFFGGVPLFVTQLLMINVVADGIPGLFIYKEHAEPDVMKKKPIKKDASVFGNGLWARLAVTAGAFTVLGLAGFVIGYHFAPDGYDSQARFEVGRTMAYLIVAFSSVINIANIRSNTVSFFKQGFKDNIVLFYTMLFSLGIVAVTALVPPLMPIFAAVPISLNLWIVAIGLSVSVLLVGELLKLLTRRNIIKVV